MLEKTNKERLASIEASQMHIEKHIKTISENNITQWTAIRHNLETCSTNKGTIWYIGAGMVALFIGVMGLYV